MEPLPDSLRPPEVHLAPLPAPSPLAPTGGGGGGGEGEADGQITTLVKELHVVHFRQFELKKIFFKKNKISALLFFVSYMFDRDCHNLNIMKREVQKVKNNFFV